MEQMYSVLGTFEADNLIAGNEVTPVLKGITLKKGQGIIKRGTVLGIISASSLCIPVDSVAVDGSESAYCILVDDADTGDETETNDYIATAYFTGVFNKTVLIFGGSDTYADHEVKLRELGIFLKEIK